MTSTAFASRRSVEIFGSRFPASIRLTSVTWTPLRCATSSWVSPRRSRASRSLVPKSATAGIVCARDRNRHRKLHKSLRKLRPLYATSGRKTGEPATATTPADRDRPLHRVLAVLRHMHAREDVTDLRDLHCNHLPSLSSADGGTLGDWPKATTQRPRPVPASRALAVLQHMHTRRDASDLCDLHPKSPPSSSFSRRSHWEEY